MFGTNEGPVDVRCDGEEHGVVWFVYGDEDEDEDEDDGTT